MKGHLLEIRDVKKGKLEKGDHLHKARDLDKLVKQTNWNMIFTVHFSWI